jgi:hypothetical protein
VDSLVGKSLLRQDDDVEPRFTMLQTIREFAQGDLDEETAAETVRGGHSDFFLALAE